MPHLENDQLTEEETAKRRDEALRRMLSTPAQPHKPNDKTAKNKP